MGSGLGLLRGLRLPDPQGEHSQRVGVGHQWGVGRTYFAAGAFGGQTPGVSTPSA
ncbi:hypothetical protein QFZ43_008353 [Streptomyces afghaniensis]|nr:hypothetical protein [Streptomyces afghaniensis]